MTMLVNFSSIITNEKVCGPSGSGTAKSYMFPLEPSIRYQSGVFGIGVHSSKLFIMDAVVIVEVVVQATTKGVRNYGIEMDRK